MKSSAFDLSDINESAIDEGSWMTVMNPEGTAPLTNVEGEQIKIKVVGPDSSQYRKRFHQSVNSRLVNSKFKVGTSEKMEEDATELLVACTVGWSGFRDKNEVFLYSPDNARVLYSKRPLAFIREQVDKFIADRTNFL